jgi:dihydroorotase
MAAVARGAPQIGRLLVNIARTGVAPGGELMDLTRADVGLARGAIARHRDVVVGIKARLSENGAGANDLEALRRAQEAAAPFNLPVMIHVGQNYSPMRAILALLSQRRPADRQVECQHRTGDRHGLHDLGPAHVQPSGDLPIPR